MVTYIPIGTLIHTSAILSSSLFIARPRKQYPSQIETWGGDLPRAIEHWNTQGGWHGKWRT